MNEVNIHLHTVNTKDVWGYKDINGIPVWTKLVSANTIDEKKTDTEVEEILETSEQVLEVQDSVDTEQEETLSEYVSSSDNAFLEEQSSEINEENLVQRKQKFVQNQKRR